MIERLEILIFGIFYCMNSPNQYKPSFKNYAPLTPPASKNESEFNLQNKAAGSAGSTKHTFNKMHYEERFKPTKFAPTHTNQNSYHSLLQNNKNNSSSPLLKADYALSRNLNHSNNEGTGIKFSDMKRSYIEPETRDSNFNSDLN